MPQNELKPAGNPDVQGSGSPQGRSGHYRFAFPIHGMPVIRKTKEIKKLPGWRQLPDLMTG